MNELLDEFERLDHTNLLDVLYGIISLYVALEAAFENTEGALKEEYVLYLFHTNDLLDRLKEHPEEKEDLFATALDILSSCAELDVKESENHE